MPSPAAPPLLDAPAEDLADPIAAAAAGRDDALAFFVPGQEAPGGSKRAIVGGKARVIDGAKGNRSWRHDVAQAAVDAMGGLPLRRGPVALSLRFILARPARNFGIGRNLGRPLRSARWWPTVKPDLTKLCRSAEDAMSGTVWDDDTRVVRKGGGVGLRRAVGAPCRPPAGRPPQPETRAMAMVVTMPMPATEAAAPPRIEPWIHTSRGRRFYPLDPMPHEVVIDDIACGLTRSARFAGQVHSNDALYSVAEHSFWVSRLVQEAEFILLTYRQLAERLLRAEDDGDVAMRRRIRGEVRPLEVRGGPSAGELLRELIATCRPAAGGPGRRGPPMSPEQAAFPFVERTSSAVLSACRRYRYRLARRWGDAPPAVVVMLNPSTADDAADDPTVRRCIGFARRWGHGGLDVVNLFALRSTDPRALLTAEDPVGPGNDAAILAVARDAAGPIVCAWGIHGAYRGRGRAVAGLLRNAGVRLHALALTASEHPDHPPRLPKGLDPIPLGGPES